MSANQSENGAPVSEGGDESFNRMYALAYGELRDIAHRHMARRARPGERSHTIGTTALVNEAYLKLVDQPHGYFADRPHFLAVASVAMRHILIDRAKAQAAEKRGGEEGMAITLDEEAFAQPDSPAALLEVNEALDRVALIDARLAQVVVYRFFGGLLEEEIAQVLGVTLRTVQRDWSKARMLLRQELER